MALTFDTALCFTKYDGKAAGFDFYNDTDVCIGGGVLLSDQGGDGFCGVTPSPIPSGKCGTAEFAMPVNAYCITKADPEDTSFDLVAQDYLLGDQYMHPVTGKLLGYVVSDMSNPANASDCIAARAGDNCICIALAPVVGV